MDFFNFQYFLDILLNTGFVQLVVPFILTFTLLFIAISQTKYFNNSITGLLSAVISFIVLIPHVIGRYERCWDFVDIVNRGLPKFGIFLLAVIVLVMLMLIIGINTDFLKNYPRILFFLTLVVVGYITLTSKPRSCPTLDMQNLPWGWISMAGLLVVLVLFWKKS